MSFLRKYRFDFFLLILQLILLFVNFLGFSVLLANNTLKSVVAVSGTFGDTVGGLLGPTLAAIGGYLAYRAYKEQKAANVLQNAEITRQSAILFIDGLRLELDNIVFKGYESKAGIQAAWQAVQPKPRTNDDLVRTPVPNSSQVDVCNQLSDFLTKINNAWASVATLAVNEKATIAPRFLFTQLIEYYLKNYYPAHNRFHQILLKIEKHRSSNDYTPREISDINSLIISTNRFVEQLKLLEMSAFVSFDITKIKTVSSDEFFEEEKVNFNLINEKEDFIVKLIKP